MSFRNLEASRCRYLLLSNINNKEGKEGWKENQKEKKVSYFSKTLRTFGFFFLIQKQGKINSRYSKISTCPNHCYKKAKVKAKRKKIFTPRKLQACRTNVDIKHAFIHKYSTLKYSEKLLQLSVLFGNSPGYMFGIKNLAQLLNQKTLPSLSKLLTLMLNQHKIFTDSNYY